MQGNSTTKAICHGCGQLKPITDFPVAATRRKRTREWNAKHSKTKTLNRNLVRSFGITLEEYNAMLVAQDGLCAICGQPPTNTSPKNWRLHVDHCHTCSGIRMLLCSTCNNGLGCFKDSPELLRKAIDYLAKHTHVNVTPIYRTS